MNLNPLRTVLQGVVFGCLVSLVGAGCAVPLVSQPVQRTRPLYAPPSGLPSGAPQKAPIMKSPEGIQWSQQKYDLKVDQLDLAQYTMPTSVAKKVIAQQSCGSLKSASTSTAYLGVDFSDALCAVLRLKGQTVVVVLGVWDGYEGYPLLSESMLVLGEAGFLNGFLATSTPASRINANVYRSYKPVEFPSKEFQKNYREIWKTLHQMMNRPSSEVQQAFEEWKKYVTENYNGESYTK